MCTGYTLTPSSSPPTVAPSTVAPTEKPTRMPSSFLIQETTTDDNGSAEFLGLSIWLVLIIVFVSLIVVVTGIMVRLRRDPKSHQSAHRASVNNAISTTQDTSDNSLQQVINVPDTTTSSVGLTEAHAENKWRTALAVIAAKNAFADAINYRSQSGVSRVSADSILTNDGSHRSATGLSSGGALEASV